MTASQYACALLLAVMQVTCGEGLSTDPNSIGDKPRPSRDGGSDADANIVEDVSSGPNDADDETMADGPPESGPDQGSTADGSADVASDRPDGPFADADVSIDARDASIDARDGSSPDVSADMASPDRGGNGTDSSDEPSSDAGHDAAEEDSSPPGCTTGCYYVDALAAPNGDGSRAKPFKTITAAIAAHQMSPVARTAHVAPGRYDAALGETFPLVLRGLSLEGSGRDQTFVVGSGFIDHAEDGGIMNGQYMLTILSGDRELPTKISKISVASGTPVPLRNYFGILCDRGNATGEVTSPRGQTHLDRLTLGPGYHTGVAVSTSTSPFTTGCNMMVTGSILTGGWNGLHAVGCDELGPANPVIVEMGGADPSMGNVISWMETNVDDSYGVLLGPCVVRGFIENNVIVDDMFGVVINGRNGGPGASKRAHFTIKNNSFQRLSSGGLWVRGNEPIVDELADNRFERISRAEGTVSGPPAQALLADVTRLGKVRRNQFVGNDIGVSLDFAYTPDAPADFGTPADLGGNVFRCNSSNGFAGDFQIVGNGVNPVGPISLAGNAWDHPAPTIQTSAPYANGVDIALSGAPGATVDIGSSSQSSLPCPDGRVPGP